MKIAFLSEYIFPFHKGGAEKRFYEVARRLAQKGHEVYWFGMKSWEGADTIEFEDVHLHGICRQTEPFTRTGRRSIRGALYFSWHLFRHLRTVDIREFDIVDCSLYPFFHCWVTKLFTRKKIPLVITWHEFWGDYWYEYLGPLGFFGKWVEWLTSRLANGIVTASHMAKRGLLQLRLSGKRILIIENGIDFNAIRSVNASASRSDLVYFGRLKNHKNLEVLIKAAKVLVKQFPELQTVIIGDGPERTNLINLVDQRELSDTVKFLGLIEDDEELMATVKASKVFVHPSTKEGGGSITLLEANAYGLPAIAVKHELGIDKELIEDGVNGFWVEALSPELIADKVALLLADEKVLKRMSEASVKFARQFDWSRKAEMYEAFYREILSEFRQEMEELCHKRL